MSRHHPTPDRRPRPSAEELGGTSEYQIRSASNEDQEDPVTSVIAAAEAAEEPDRDRSLAEESLSVDPDELGADYLRGAVQDPRRAEVEEPELEKLETRSEEAEGDLSRLTEEVGKEIRIPDRAARIREQSRRVAELRAGGGGEYLGRRKKSRRGTSAPR